MYRSCYHFNGQLCKKNQTAVLTWLVSARAIITSTAMGLLLFYEIIRTEKSENFITLTTLAEFQNFI